MKVAYLISAHNDPEHLQRLVDALQLNAEFFIHIDAKADIAPFQDRLHGPRIHFTRRRADIGWGNFTQVRYQRILLEEYFQSGTACDRLFTLSGLDYPLWSNDAIDHFLEQAGARELIQGIDLTQQRDSVTQGYRLYRPLAEWRMGCPWAEAKLRILARKVLAATGLRKKLTFTAGGRTYRLHKGSSWWCVTPALARYWLDELNRCPEIERYFKTSFGPDETLWQTLTFHSPFAGRALLTTTPYTSLADLTPLHYIYYHPVIKILTEADWDTLRLSHKMFCRKTVSGVSDALMRRIDQERARGGENQTAFSS